MTSLHATNVYNIADHAPRPARGQAARLPRTARQGAEVESGETATRDAGTNKGPGAPLNVGGERTVPPLLPSSLVATIANCPTMTADGRRVFLVLGGVAWRDEIGWRWTNSRSPRIHDIWNPALIEALDERAAS